MNIVELGNGIEIQDTWKGPGFSITMFWGRSSGVGNTVPSNANWPTANKAYYWPIFIPFPIYVDRFWWMDRAVSVSGTPHIELAIYDYKTNNQLFTSGEQNTTGGAALLYANISGGARLMLPGSYWFAVACDTVTTSGLYYYASSLIGAQLSGGAQETSAYPLPATLTPAQMSGTFILPIAGCMTPWAAK